VQRSALQILEGGRVRRVMEAAMVVNVVAIAADQARKERHLFSRKASRWMNADQ
jgi:hypothetical protein